MTAHGVRLPHLLQPRPQVSYAPLFRCSCYQTSRNCELSAASSHPQSKTPLSCQVQAATLAGALLSCTPKGGGFDPQSGPVQQAIS